METVRLRKLQQGPSYVERLLETLVVRGNLVPDGAYQIRQPTAIPKALRAIADNAAQNGQVSSCWAHTFNFWMFIGEMLLAASRERGAPVLQVDVYNEDGLKESALWAPGREGEWRRCSE